MEKEIRDRMNKVVDWKKMYELNKLKNEIRQDLINKGFDFDDSSDFIEAYL